MYVTGVTFLMDNSSEIGASGSYVCHWCHGHWCHLPYMDTAVKISASGLMYVTGVTFLMDNTSEDQLHQVLCMSLVSPSLWITPVKISASGLMYSLVSPSFMDNSSEDQCIGSYLCHWSHGHWLSPSLWITAVKISASGLMYVTGVTVTGVTFLMDNTSEDQCIRSYACHCV